MAVGAAANPRATDPQTGGARWQRCGGSWFFRSRRGTVQLYCAAAAGHPQACSRASSTPCDEDDGRRGNFPRNSQDTFLPGCVMAGLAPKASSRGRVKGIVRNGPEAIMISSKEIAGFRRQWLWEWRVHLPRLHVVPTIKVGDWIAIPSGAFSGAPVRVERVEKNGTIRAQLGGLEVTFNVSALPQPGARDRGNDHAAADSKSLGVGPARLTAQPLVGKTEMQGPFFSRPSATASSGDPGGIQIYSSCAAVPGIGRSLGLIKVTFHLDQLPQPGARDRGNGHATAHQSV